MAPFRNVMVPVAMSPSDTALLDYALLLAGKGVIEDWRMVHVCEHGHVPQFPPEVMRHGTPLMLEGTREDALLRYAAESKAELLLVGHGVDRRGYRSLARRLAMQAPCSVWMAPQGSAVRLDRILAPVDYSDRAADALETALEIATAAGTPHVFVLHVLADRSRSLDAHRAELEAFVEPLRVTGAGMELLVEESAQVAATIERVAAGTETDLLVLNTRGRSRSAAVLLGSVTDQILQETRRPILAVKHHGAKLNLLRVLLED